MSKSGYLTAAEYKAIRQTLGFTLEEAKEFHKVQNISTIKRWENGYSRVSELACNKIMELFEKINWTISEGLERYKSLPEEIRKETGVVLIVYPDSCYKKFAVGFEDLPNSVHRAMVQRTYVAFKEIGAEVGVVEFNPQDYMTFLAQNLLQDTQYNRGAWAADYRRRILQ